MCLGVLYFKLKEIFNIPSSLFYYGVVLLYFVVITYNVVLWIFIFFLRNITEPFKIYHHLLNIFPQISSCINPKVKIVFLLIYVISYMIIQWTDIFNKEISVMEYINKGVHNLIKVVVNDDKFCFQIFCMYLLSTVDI